MELGPILGHMGIGGKLPTINYQIPTTHCGRLKQKTKRENAFGNLSTSEY